MARGVEVNKGSGEEGVEAMSIMDILDSLDNAKCVVSLVREIAMAGFFSGKNVLPLSDAGEVGLCLVLRGVEETIDNAIQSVPVAARES